uniref:O antigen polymerase n=1 Tax=Aeromonas hydrophila TaxID=644 RepID=A0A346AC67_AERHY|nr:O antigen polymerase [Aeromonas hydrophila]
MIIYRNETDWTARRFFACLFFFIGCSVANALGGLWQAAFYILSLGLIFIGGRVFYSKGLYFFILSSALLILILNHRDSSAGFIRVILESYIQANILIYFFRIKKYNDILILLKSFVLFQVVFLIFMLGFPQIRELLLNYFYEGDAYQGEAFQTAISYRGFGISKHHLYGLPLAISFCVALIITDRHESLSVKFFYFLLGSLLVALNARIGLVIILLALFWMLTTFSKSNVRHTFALVVALSLISLIVFLLSTIFSFSENMTLHWLKEGVSQLSNSNSNKATTLSDLRGMIHIPSSSWELIFGRSYDCNINSGCYSDIGFVRLINSGGLISLFIVSLLYLYISIFFWDSSSWKYSVSRCMLLSFVFFVAMFKGEAYSASDYSRAFMVTCLIMMKIKIRKSNEAPSS